MFSVSMGGALVGRLLRLATLSTVASILTSPATERNYSVTLKKYSVANSNAASTSQCFIQFRNYFNKTIVGAFLNSI